jgi:gentisate 1,2-dioxygenase
MALTSHPIPDGLQDFTRALDRAHLDAPWLGPEMSHAPMPQMRPFLWRWDDIEPLIMRTGELMTPGRGAERRILRLANPGVAGKTSCSCRESAPQLIGIRQPQFASSCRGKAPTRRLKGSVAPWSRGIWC